MCRRGMGREWGAAHSWSMNIVCRNVWMWTAYAWEDLRPVIPLMPAGTWLLPDQMRLSKSCKMNQQSGAHCKIGWSFDASKFNWRKQTQSACFQNTETMSCPFPDLCDPACNVLHLWLPSAIARNSDNRCVVQSDSERMWGHPWWRDNPADHVWWTAYEMNVCGEERNFCRSSGSCRLKVDPTQPNVLSKSYKMNPQSGGHCKCGWSYDAPRCNWRKKTQRGSLQKKGTIPFPSQQPFAIPLLICPPSAIAQNLDTQRDLFPAAPHVSCNLTVKACAEEEMGREGHGSLHGEFTLQTMFRWSSSSSEMRNFGRSSGSWQLMQELQNEPTKWCPLQE